MLTVPNCTHTHPRMSKVYVYVHVISGLAAAFMIVRSTIDFKYRY